MPRPGCPRPAESLPTHMCEPALPTFTLWRARTGLAVSTFRHLALIASSSSRPSLRDDDPFTTRWLGPLGGTTATKGRGSIPRGGAAAALSP